MEADMFSLATQIWLNKASILWNAFTKPIDAKTT